MTTAGSGVELIRCTDLAAVPWRNGGGTTREVLRFPPDAPSSDFAARISIADVDASGPFSAYPGVDRIIMLLDGPSMRLTVDGRVVDLVPWLPFTFAGDSITVGEVGSPTRDLNVMTRRGRASASIRVVRGGSADIAADEAEHLVIVGLAGRGCTVAVPDAPGGTRRRAAESDRENVVQLGNLDSLALRGPRSVTVTGGAAVITVTMSPHGVEAAAAR